MLKSYFIWVYFILAILAYCPTALGQSISSKNILLSEQDSFSTKSNTLVVFQLGGNNYNEMTPSFNASILFKLKYRLLGGLFYEHLLSPFTDKYPAVWETTVTYPGMYGRKEISTGPFYGNLDFGQNVIGVRGLFLTSKNDRGDGIYLGGGIGIYMGSLTRKTILGISESKHAFKKSIGYHVLSAFRVSITNNFGLLFSVKDHIIHRELDISESSHVSLEYDALGRVTSECRGEVCTYYINQYEETGRIIKVYEFKDVDKRSGAYNNFSLQVGIFFNIY